MHVFVYNNINKVNSHTKNAALDLVSYIIYLLAQPRVCVCTCSRSIVYRCDESRVLTCSNKLTPFLERKKIGFRANFCRNAIACENFELILL